MSLSFATPLGALIALAAIVPVAAVLAVRLRARHLRRTLGLAPPRRLAAVPSLVSVVAVGVLLALAAAQPLLERTERHPVRTDAEAYVVVDVTRSMLASRTPTSRIRLERARDAAVAIRSRLAGIPVGVASMTDRVLPHLFPSPDAEVFRVTVQRSLGIERPPPRSGFGTNVTSIGALDSFPSLGFFSPTATKRVLVVVTDGESQPIDPTRLAVTLGRPPAISPIFVHVWNASERVYTRGIAEPQYEPDPAARRGLERIAAVTRGSVFPESRPEAAAAAARKALGSGPTVERGESEARTALAPFLALGALLPLGVALLVRDR